MDDVAGQSLGRMVANAGKCSDSVVVVSDTNSRGYDGV